LKKSFAIHTATSKNNNASYYFLKTHVEHPGSLKQEHINLSGRPQAKTAAQNHKLIHACAFIRAVCGAPAAKLEVNETSVSHQPCAGMAGNGWRYEYGSCAFPRFRK